MLRAAFPQFAQRSRESNAMAQQDAEECWSQILSILRTNVKTPGSDKSFVDTFMSGSMTSTLTCDESTDEPAVSTTESFLKLNCHIEISTNFMRDGILSALSGKLEKHSDILDRNAVWTKKSQISRLPKYLVVHFVRFYWKRESGKKAKILRKIKFPMEFDTTEFCTEELKKKTLPVRDALREVRKKHEEAERARKRARVQAEVDSTDGKTKETEEKSDEMDLDDVDPESLIDPELKGDVGSNPTGLYELTGILTHAGSNADSGHWQGWTKQTEGGMSRYTTFAYVR
jgi:ubiquitin carboxyl-terminal hydrolase 14